MKATRTEVYAVIDGERDYQDAGKGNSQRHPDMPPQMTPGECLLCMEELLEQARTAWYKPNGSTACLDSVRKLTAVGVQCLEAWGAPAREVKP